MQKILFSFLMMGAALHASEQGIIKREIVAMTQTSKGDVYTTKVNFKLSKSLDFVESEKHECSIQFLPDDKQPEDSSEVCVILNTVDKADTLKTRIVLPCHQGDIEQRNLWQKRALKDLCAHVASLSVLTELGANATVLHTAIGLAERIAAQQKLKEQERESKERRQSLESLARKAMQEQSSTGEENAKLKAENEKLKKEIEELKQSKKAISSQNDDA